MKYLLCAATVLLPLALAVPACGSDDGGGTSGNPVALNCGFTDSPGNEIGIGKYCTESSDCPAVTSGTSLQCSTVIVDNTVPLICSRLCDAAAADPGCGTGAVCKNIQELGFDLNVCVPTACQPLFSTPL